MQTDRLIDIRRFIVSSSDWYEDAPKKNVNCVPHPILCRSLPREEPAHKQWALSLCTWRMWTNLIKSRCHLNLKCRIIWKGLEKGLQAYVV